MKAGASVFFRSGWRAGHLNRWQWAAIARCAYRFLFLAIHPLLHRNNYKIKADQIKSLIQVNNSFNFQ
ncbi:hypothetical protein M3665_26875, partial [Bacillus licheniformis]|nr:hypothetical protein [Bacillus licheniformis]